MSGRRLQVVFDITSVAIFATALSAPLVGMWAGLGQLQGREEKRQLAALPVITPDLRSWAAAPAAFTAYFNDHFGFRKTLVQVYGLVKVRVLGESTSPDVVVGKQGWLYYCFGLCADSYRGLEPFAAGELRQWTDILRRMRDWLAARRIPFYVIIPPDKHTIYPEYLPASVQPGGAATRLETLTTALRETDIDVIDIRASLLRAKSTGLLYHKTDTHWTGNAGYVAYEAILSELSMAFPHVHPYPRADFQWWRPRATGDLNGMLGLTRGYEEDYLFLVPGKTAYSRHEDGKVVVTEIDDPQLPRMVMMRDSFANFMIPLLSQNFRRAVYIWDNTFDPALIEREKPDLVLFELVERRLVEGTARYPSPSQSLAAKLGVSPDSQH
jgi:hypothetical protein